MCQFNSLHLASHTLFISFQRLFGNLPLQTSFNDQTSFLSGSVTTEVALGRSLRRWETI